MYLRTPRFTTNKIHTRTVLKRRRHTIMHTYNFRKTRLVFCPWTPRAECCGSIRFRKSWAPVCVRVLWPDTKDWYAKWSFTFKRHRYTRRHYPRCFCTSCCRVGAETVWSPIARTSRPSTKKKGTTWCLRSKTISVVSAPFSRMRILSFGLKWPNALGIGRPREMGSGKLKHHSPETGEEWRVEIWECSREEAKTPQIYS